MSDAALPNPIPPLDASPEIKEMVEWLETLADDARAGFAVDARDLEPEDIENLGRTAALLRRLGEREARMREALYRIGDEERWSDFPIDSGGANTASRIIVEMQESARAALAAGKEGE